MKEEYKTLCGVSTMNYVDRINIWYSVIKSLILTFNGIKRDFYDSDETVNEILKGKSLIRFGDGEFGIYRKKSIHYQKWSEELKNEFVAIKEEYEDDYSSCPYILAVPRRFMEVSGFSLMRKRVYVSSWSQSRYDFKKNFRDDIPYGDSFLFEKANKSVYSRIWKDKNCPNNIIFIHNSEQYARLFSDTYGKNVLFIQCPAHDAYQEINEIESNILRVINEQQLRMDDVMVTISAGPAGKVLVYRLSQRGYWCIDAGHCWDDPLEGI